MDHQSIIDLLAAQEQVISRKHVLAAGGDDDDVARMLRRRTWVAVHPGVYVAHTGPLTRAQREWAAVLHHAPAALTGWSALRRYGVATGRQQDNGDTDSLVHVAVARDRRLRSRPGIETVRLTRFADDVLLNLSPPRIRLEQVVLDVASAARSEAAAVAVLADAVGSRRTTADRLLGALGQRPRLARRAFLVAVLRDVAEGTHSVLERAYLVEVERRHRLPRGSRQRPASTGARAAYRDVAYADHATVVELDGRLGHELALDRWDDLERDLSAAEAGTLTLRLGWGQVLEPCRTARSVGRVLSARGWAGRARACGNTCAVGVCGA